MSERLGEPPKNNDYWVGYLSYTIGAFVNGDIDREGLEEMYREFMADATISPELRATLPPAPRVFPRAPRRSSQRRGFLDGVIESLTRR